MYSDHSFMTGFHLQQLAPEANLLLSSRSIQRILKLFPPECAQTAIAEEIATIAENISAKASVISRHHAQYFKEEAIKLSESTPLGVAAKKLTEALAVFANKNPQSIEFDTENEAIFGAFMFLEPEQLENYIVEKSIEVVSSTRSGFLIPRNGMTFEEAAWADYKTLLTFFQNSGNSEIGVSANMVPALWPNGEPDLSAEPTATSENSIITDINWNEFEKNWNDFDPGP